MKALTLWRPWPVAIIRAGKRVENRGWVPPSWLIGKDFALHAGKTVDKDTCEDLVDDFGIPREAVPGDLGIVAVVRLAGYVAKTPDGGRVRSHIGEAIARQIVESQWRCGPVGWVLDNVRPLAVAVPCKGAQGLWNVPPDIEAAVVAQLQKGHRAA